MKKRRDFGLLILGISFVLLVAGFAYADYYNIADSTAKAGSEVSMLAFNITNNGTPANTLNSVTIDLTSTASSGDLTNVTLSDGTNVHYNDSFSSFPVIIDVSTAISSETNYTLNLTIGNSVADDTNIRVNVTDIDSQVNVTYSALPYTSGFTTVDSLEPFLEYGEDSTVSSASQSYIYVNISAQDTVSSLDTIKIYLYKSSTLQNSSSNSSLGSGTSAEHIFNFTGLSDGTYYVNATANDTYGHENNSLETKTITLDNVDPTASVSCNDITKGEDQDCSCSGTDSGSGIASTSITTADTSTTGDKTVTCTATDNAGNSDSASTTYTVSSDRDDDDGVTYRKYSPSEEDLNEGYDLTRLNTGDIINFEIGETGHTLKIDETTKDKVTMTVSSEHQTFDLSIGEEKKLELTEDDFYDLSVKLNNITGYYNYADMTLKTIHEKVSETQPSEDEPPTDEEDQEPGEESSETPEEKEKSGWIWWVFGILLVGLIIWYVYNRKQP